MTQPTKKRRWRIRSRLWWLTWLVPAILFVTLGSISAEQGDARTQNDLGNMYYFGRGVPKNYAKALELFGKSAEQGFAEAQNNLGNMYYSGAGVPKDDKKAAHWWLKAAKQGDAWAQYSLGMMYHSTKSDLQDYKKSYMWYSLTIHNRWSIARGDRDTVAKKLSSQDLIEAKKMTKRCLDSGYKDC